MDGQMDWRTDGRMDRQQRDRETTTKQARTTIILPIACNFLYADDVALLIRVFTGPPSTSNFECQICHRMCRSRIGLLAHNKSHSWWWDPLYRRLSPWLIRERYARPLDHLRWCAWSLWITFKRTAVVSLRTSENK